MRLFTPLHNVAISSLLQKDAVSAASAEVRILMFMLVHYSPKKVVFFEQADIIRGTGVARSTVARSLRDLTAAGFLFAKLKPIRRSRPLLKRNGEPCEEAAAYALSPSLTYQTQRKKV